MVQQDFLTRIFDHPVCIHLASCKRSSECLCAFTETCMELPLLERWLYAAFLNRSKSQ